MDSGLWLAKPPAMIVKVSQKDDLISQLQALLLRNNAESAASCWHTWVLAEQHAKAWHQGLVKLIGRFISHVPNKIRWSILTIFFIVLSRTYSNWVSCSFVVSNRECLAVKLQNSLLDRKYFLLKLSKNGPLPQMKSSRQNPTSPSSPNRRKSTICACVYGEVKWGLLMKQIICTHCFATTWGREGSVNTDE